MKKLLFLLFLFPALCFGAQNTTISGKNLTGVSINTPNPLGIEGLTFYADYSNPYNGDSSDFSLGNRTINILVNRTGTSIAPGMYTNSTGTIINATAINDTSRITYGFYNDTGFYAAQGLLIEGSRINLLTNSTLYNKTGSWTADNITAIDNVDASPNGLNNASTLTAIADNGTIVRATAQLGQAYSVYLKRKTGTGKIYITGNTSAAWTEVNPSNTTWSRFNVNAPASATQKCGIKIETNGDVLDAWLSQYEAAIYPSTPIIKLTTALTREIDKVKYSIPNNLDNVTRSVVMKFIPLSTGFISTGNSKSLMISDEGSMALRSLAGNTIIQYYPNVINNSTVSISGQLSPRAWEACTVGVSSNQTSGIIKMYVNGYADAAPVTSTWRANPWNSTSMFALGWNLISSTRELYGIIQDVAIFDKELSDAEQLTIFNQWNPSFVSEGIVLDPDGSNEWVQSPTAIRYVGAYDKIYYGSASSTGDIKISSYNSATKENIHFTLNSVLGVDDHNTPTILIRPDGRIIVFYSAHSGGALYCRISTNPEDISAFGAEVAVATGGNITYPTPIYLSAEGKIYVFFRGYNAMGRWAYITSSDDGVTWSANVDFFNNSLVNAQSYLKVISNNVDTIWFAQASHPDFGAAAGHDVFAFYYNNNTLYQSNGTSLGNFSTILPLDLINTTQVFNGTTVDCWINDIAVNGTTPYVTYITYPTGNTTVDMKWARWNGTGWDSHNLTSSLNLGGGSAYTYSNFVMDKLDPNTVYLTTPVTAGSNAAFDLKKYVTADNGATWTVTNITSNSLNKNFRPTSIFNHDTTNYLMWSTGVWDAYTSYKNRRMMNK